MDLSIITLTIPERKASLKLLSDEIQLQRDRGKFSVEHVVVPSSGTVSEKISEGLSKATGRYVTVVDDDDMISHDYLSSIIHAIQFNPDVVTFGMQTPGNPACWLRVGITDGARTDDTTEIVKTANHLCAWKRGYAMAAPCVPRNYGWDVIWYRALRERFPNLTELHIPRVLYQYNFSREGTRAQSPESIADSMDNSGAEIKIVQLPDGRLMAGRHISVMYNTDAFENDLTGVEVKLIDEVIFR
jgi:hypothetical protein